MEIKVTSLKRLKQAVVEYAPTHVVSVLDPDFSARHDLPFDPTIDVLRLAFYDDDDLAHQTVPVEHYVRQIADFLQQARSTPASRLLVHCHAGASRSPAIAYMAYCIELGSERAAFEQLMRICNKPWPSEHIVGLADRVLNRNGRMLEQLRAYRDRYPRRFAAYQRLNRRRDLFSY
ncbi:dual specificity protein phosphatase family protein [Pseudoduganella armeniaca]|uniref:Protein tyrosine phosphatase n=1 Tax=Pseudoduganella armeniaca TaxID=2072590 RepID=A0A2R4CGY6_9BURK|nr:dual specificity protein phosphatase family protein [Pseudoduganella armeniaca]AVR98921.1 protein tyrosine phosphatase [Pseudoduganella armeniaca]